MLDEVNTFLPKMKIERGRTLCFRIIKIDNSAAAYLAFDGVNRDQSRWLEVFNFNSSRYESCLFSKNLINSMLYEVCKRDIDNAKEDDYKKLKNFEYKINVQPSWRGAGIGNDYKVIKKCLNKPYIKKENETDPLEMLKELEPIELKQAEKKKEKEMAKTPRVIITEASIDDLEKQFEQIEEDEKFKDIEMKVDSEYIRYEKLEAKIDKLLEKRKAVSEKFKLVNEK